MSIDIRDIRTLTGAVPAPDKTAAASGRNIAGPGDVFAGQLDRALETKNDAQTTASRARNIAEALSLQMLQTTLSLATENSPETARTAIPFDLPSQRLKALVNSYGINQPDDLSEKTSPPAKPSQLHEIEPAPVTTAHGPRVSAPGERWLDPIIDAASSRYGVDSGLIRAVIKAESNFDPHAVSHAGARGLMQLMPGTARSLGVNDSFDPEQNVMGGTRFLADLLKRYNGNIDSALAAYNWGPGNVDKRPDRLPRETREYLVRVKQLYDSYSA